MGAGTRSKIYDLTYLSCLKKKTVREKLCQIPKTSIQKMLDADKKKYIARHMYFCFWLWMCFFVFLSYPSKLPPVNFPCLCCDRPWPGQSMATTKKPDSARAGANLDSGESKLGVVREKHIWKYKNRLWK